MLARDYSLHRRTWLTVVLGVDTMEGPPARTCVFGSFPEQTLFAPPAIWDGPFFSLHPTRPRRPTVGLKTVL